MSKNHFKLPDKPDDPVPKVVDSMEGTAMWEVSLAAPEGECNIVQGPSTARNSILSRYIWVVIVIVVQVVLH